MVLDLAISGVIFGMVVFVLVALFKWLAVRRYSKTAVPMWTPFVWLSEAVTNLYEGLAVPNFLRYLRGTPWLPLALNLMGSRIASSAWLDTTDITEHDCVQIGEHSELNALCCPQTHLFEDRVMKIDQVLMRQPRDHGCSLHGAVWRKSGRRRAAGAADAGDEGRGFACGHALARCTCIARAAQAGISRCRFSTALWRAGRCRVPRSCG